MAVVKLAWPRTVSAVVSPAAGLSKTRMRLLSSSDTYSRPLASTAIPIGRVMPVAEVSVVADSNPGWPRTRSAMVSFGTAWTNAGDSAISRPAATIPAKARRIIRSLSRAIARRQQSIGIDGQGHAEIRAEDHEVDILADEPLAVFPAHVQPQSRVDVACSVECRMRHLLPPRAGQRDPAARRDDVGIFGRPGDQGGRGLGEQLADRIFKFALVHEIGVGADPVRVNDIHQRGAVVVDQRVLEIVQ